MSANTKKSGILSSSAAAQPASAALWTRLRAGGYREARQDFEQALALDPTLPWAREGLVFALKARSPVYGLLLRFFHWSGNFTPRTRNLMALGAVLAYSVLRRQGEAYPALKPVIIPLLAAYLASKMPERGLHHVEPKVDSLP